MAAAGFEPGDGQGIMAAEQEAEETVSQELHSPSKLRIVLLGGSSYGKAGKSEAGNTILGRKVFRSGPNLSTGTQECENRTREVSGRRVTVVDTPHLLKTDRVEIERCLSLSAPGPHAFLLVIPVYPKEFINGHTAVWESIVQHDCKALHKVQELFGERAVRNTMILFTFGDHLRGRTIEQYIEEAGEELQQLVEKCGNRYHVLNNEDRSDHTQVTQLLDKIDNMVKGSGDFYLPNEIYQQVQKRIRLKEQELNKNHKEELSRSVEEMKQKYEEEQRRREEEMKQKYEQEQRRREEKLMEKFRKQMKEGELEKEAEESKLPVRRRNSIDGGYRPNSEDNQAPPSPPELRMVLLGKTGAGKSAAGNTILGREEFRSVISGSSVTRVCEKRRGEVAGRQLTVIDAPDLLHITGCLKEICHEIRRCILLSSPGPHAFLLVLQARRFTDEEKTVLQAMEDIFSETALAYTMVLFTHGDNLEEQSIEDYIETQGRELQQLVKKCGNRYHVLNNKNRSDRTQVTQLLDKIDNMVKGNRGSFLYQEAEERLTRREQRYEEQCRKEEELKHKYEEEHLRKVEELKQRYEEEKHQKEKELKQKYEEEQREKEEELKQKYEEEQSRKAEELKKEYEEGLLRKEEELNQKYKEQERKAEEMKQKLEEERLGKAEEVKQRYEAQRVKAEQQKQQYEEEQRRNAQEIKHKYETQCTNIQKQIQKYAEEQIRKVEELKKTFAEELWSKAEELKQKYEEEEHREIEELKQKYREREGRLLQKHEEEHSEEIKEIKHRYNNKLHREIEKQKKEYEERERQEVETLKQKHQEAMLRKEQELKQQYEEEYSEKEQQLKKRYEEQCRGEEEMKQRLEEEQQRKLEEVIQNYEKQCQGVEEMKQRYKEEHQREVEKLKHKHEEELSRREEEMKQKYVEEQSRITEEMKQKYEEEQRRREEELMEKFRKQMKEEELEKEPEESKLPVKRRNSKELLINMSGGEGEAPTADNRVVLLGAVAGALLGAAAGALMGPWGAAAGAAIGSVAGAQVGALIGGAARAGVAESSHTHTQRSRELK